MRAASGSHPGVAHSMRENSVMGPNPLPGAGKCSYCPGGHRHSLISFTTKEQETWLGSSAGSSVLLIGQLCRFDPWSGYVQESTNECIDKWNNK